MVDKSPAIFHHSSQGLEYNPNKHLCVCVYQGPACEVCGWKKKDDIFWKIYIHFWLAIQWASNVCGYPLPRTACWGSSKPQYTQKVFCCYAFRERFFMHSRIFKITWFRKESGDFLFNKKAHHLTYCLSHKI